MGQTFGGHILIALAKLHVLEGSKIGVTDHVCLKIFQTNFYYSKNSIVHYRKDFYKDELVGEAHQRRRPEADSAGAVNCTCSK